MRLTEILAKFVGDGNVIDLGGKQYIHRDTTAEVKQQLLKIVGDFHSTNPESPGITAEQFLQASQLRKVIFDSLVKMLLLDGRLVERKHRIALPEHQEAISLDERKLLSDVESLFRSRLFNPPTIQEVIEIVGCATHTDLYKKVEKILKMLIEQERLMRVENDLFFHAEAIEKAEQILVSFISKEGKLESVKFKYLLDTTRKFAIPLLDYFDKVGVIRRVGNTRYLKIQH